MTTVSVERFNDPNYSRPRYRIRHWERKTYLRDGFTEGSYKLKRGAELQADNLNYGPFAADAMRDKRYSAALESIPDGQELGVDTDGCVVAWDADTRSVYNTGELPASQAVLIVGNAVDGHTFIGPFASESDAVKYACGAEADMPDSWVTATMRGI